MGEDRIVSSVRFGVTKRLDDDLPGFAARVFDFAMNHPDLMRLLAWSTLENTARIPAARIASHQAKIEAIARAQAERRLNAGFSPAFLVTAIMALASAWSPAFPFGMAMQSNRRSAPAGLREQVVKAVEGLLKPK